MKRFHFKLGLLCTLLIGLKSGATAGQIFTPVDDPSALMGTIPTGIFGHEIVGYYLDGSAVPHGFHFNGSTYSTIDDPLGTMGTYARDITGNTVVGYYQDASMRFHGFEFDGTTFQTIDNPQATGPGGTFVTGIDGNKIIGYFHDSTSHFHGFVYDGSTYTTLTDPSDPQVATNTIPYGISGNSIVGEYLVNSYFGQDNSIISKSHGFINNGGSIATLDDPLRGNVSAVYGIGDNLIAGAYQDMSGLSHGFYFRSGAFATLDNPLGVGGTSLTGVDSNQIVGSYTDASNVKHGFIVAVPEPSSLAMLCAAMVIAWKVRRCRPS